MFPDSRVFNYQIGLFGAVVGASSVFHGIRLHNEYLSETKANGRNP
jgi:hypothetical protein